MFIKTCGEQSMCFKAINVNSNYVQLAINNINEYKKFINIQL